MPISEFEKPALPGDMTGEELEVAQWRVDMTAPGRWKIDEIYGEYWADQAQKKYFGKVFKKAVQSSRLKEIVLALEDGKELCS